MLDQHRFNLVAAARTILGARPDAPIRGVPVGGYQAAREAAKAAAWKAMHPILEGMAHVVLDCAENQMGDRASAYIDAHRDALARMLADKASSFVEGFQGDVVGLFSQAGQAPAEPSAAPSALPDTGTAPVTMGGTPETGTVAPMPTDGSTSTTAVEPDTESAER